MPARRKAAPDFTGRLNEKLQQEKEVELREASQRMSVISAQIDDEKNQVVDYTNSDAPIPEVELRQVEVTTPFRMIRTNQDIDQMTYGRKVTDPGDYDNPDLSQRRPAVMGPMNYMSFKEGQLARVPKEVAEYLDEKGYISYMSNG